MKDILYKKMYPTDTGMIKFYWLPEIHKTDTSQTNSI